MKNQIEFVQTCSDDIILMRLLLQKKAKTLMPIIECYDFYITSYFSPFLSLLPPVAERSWYIVISSYLSITTYCLLRRSIAQYGAAMHSLLTHAQSAYLCTARTARLPTRSLLVQYIRTLWTLTFSS